MKIEPVDLLERSYKEVLDATKHQDDKVGRFLTAFAFFAGGAIALLNQDFVKTTAYNIEPFKSVRLPAILLGLFLVLLGFTVLALLMSVGTPLKLPWSTHPASADPGSVRSGPSVSKGSDSPLYFLSIAKVTRDEWKAQIESLHWRENSSSEWLERSLVDETHNLATRTYQKYDRYSEARAIFELAVVVFTAAVALAVPAFAAKSAAPVVLEWDLPIRILVGATMGSLVAVIGYDRYRGDSSVRILGTRDRDRLRLSRQISERGQVAAASVWTCLGIVSSVWSFWQRVGCLVFCLCLWAGSVLTMKRQSRDVPGAPAEVTRQLKACAMAGGVLLAANLAIAVIPRAQTTSWWASLALVPLIGLELDQATKPSRSWRELKREVARRNRSVAPLVPPHPPASEE